MRLFYLQAIVILMILFSGCLQNNKISTGDGKRVRQLVDTVGFAQYPWQMNAFMDRLDESDWKDERKYSWRLAICPHDDYTYVGSVYPRILSKVTAPRIILIGVAHRAAQMKTEDRLVFDTYTHWKGPWSDVPVSPARDGIYDLLKNDFAIINDTLSGVEHSLEALIPFLQYFNRNVEIIPVLVPAMRPARMNECGKALAEAIQKVTGKLGWEWGDDYAVIVTTDAVHYGNEDWGGADRAYFRCDDFGNNRAIRYEHEIMNDCLLGEVVPEKIEKFSIYTLNPENFREYKWTWCGRYSVPLGMYTGFYLNNSEPMEGEFISYSTSITRFHIPVDDLAMGRTAIATRCHWVGYAAIGYK